MRVFLYCLFYLISYILFIYIYSSDNSNMSIPPIANKILHSNKVHDGILRDDYAWLRDPKWPIVENETIIKYLTEENNYYDSFFSDVTQEREKIFDELKGRIKLDDQSLYIKKDNYYYYTRVESDKEYQIYCRKLGSPNASEEILLDVNELAKGQKFTKIAAFSISPDHTMLAYSVDFSGDERYTVRVLNLKAKEYLVDKIENTIANIVWHEQLKGFFYTPIDENWRYNKVLFHYIGSDSKQDKLVLHEQDPLYSVHVSKSSSKEYIFLNIEGHNTNEVYAFSMEDHSFEPLLFRSKQEEIYYNVDHNNKYFYIRTNLGAKNFKIVRASLSDFQDSTKWLDLITRENDLYLTDFDLSRNYLILNYKKLGLDTIQIFKIDNGDCKVINFPDQAFTASAGQYNFEDNDIRVSYSSFSRPNTIYQYDFATNELSVLKVQEIPSGHHLEDYTVERTWADNKGVAIPISLVYKKSLFRKDGSNSLYLLGYGAYGISIPAVFRNSVISLIDRGFVFAIAHIRGGDDLGQDWYESAKFLNKNNTFEDFIAATKHLIEEKYTSKDNIAICGGSAGGLLIGNVINNRPDLYKAAIAHVPFVDALNTMLDESLPLTPGEFKEWGNPKEKEYFDYIKSYDPYTNVKAQNYPALLVTAGLSDPRVGYWEAAKWVAKLRATKLDDNVIVFQTNMDAGHKGASGRFDYLKEVADEIIFILKIFGKLN